MQRLIACCWLAFCCGPALAAGEFERPLAAELLVLGGDVRRMVHEKLPPLERSGLEQRVAGALSSLPLLLRRAGHAGTDAASLRAAQARGDWRGLLAAVTTLQRRSPFDARRLLDLRPSPAALALGASLHRSTCAGCHDAPAETDTQLPAKNLSKQLRSMPRDEFAARLWLGVRGDRLARHTNPFSDVELAALILLYAQAP